MQFCPLHNHSEYSALDGLSTCREIAERAVELGCPCCGITDHGTVAGHLQFAKELAKVDVKPIFGSELYHGIKPKGFTGWTRNERDSAHFVVGAMTNEGLRNLWRLTSTGSTNFRYVPRVTWDDLEGYGEGLFATSACIAGLIPQAINNGGDLSCLDKYLEIFGDNFYIELHTYPGPEHEQINHGLVQISRERGIPVVYANDAHFAFPNQYQAHDAFVAMQTGESIDTPISDRKMWHPMALYMMDEGEIRDALHYLPESVVDEALSNTTLLADKCDVQIPEIRRHLPVFIPEHSPYVDEEAKDDSAAKLFIDLVERGLHMRYKDPSDELFERAQKEMEVFLDGGLEHYFLQAWDFCKFCDTNSITRGPGRGSAAGSIVAYTLGITDVDPIRYKLSFERFYNPGRAKGFPDIDTDFPKGDRRAIKSYLAQRWGADNVRSIGNVIRMKPKAALDKTYNAMSATWSEKEAIKKIVDTVPDLEILGSDSIGWKDDGSGKTIYVWDHVDREITQYIERQTKDRQKVLWRWMDFLEIVCSRVSGYGVHASGVVVSDVPLDAELPAMWSATQEEQVTMFPMSDVEARMFVKQDILGLRTLDTLQDWHAQMKSTQGIDVQWSGLEATPQPDEMWEMIDRGLATGVFQIEDKPYVRQLAMDFKPRSVEDLSIIVALNRPGPIRSGAPDSFVARRRGDEPIAYDHPFLESLLNETYGWFLYQEQVIAFFSKLGLNESDADAVRKILGKKKPEEMKKLYKGEGEWKGKGYVDLYPKVMDDHSAQVIWDKLEDFAKYSFNKSHSIAYATIAFRTLYAKYYAPAEFLMACIRTNPDDTPLYVAEARRLGIKINTPDIEKSVAEVGVVDGEVYFGLSNVKGIGKPSAEYIVDIARTYGVKTISDLEDALKSETELWSERKAKHKESNPAPFKEKSPKTMCKANAIEALWNVGAFDANTERVATMNQMQEKEKELLGIVITDTTEEAFRNNADLVEECDTYDWFNETHSAGVSGKLPGTIISIRPTKTRQSQKDMGIVKIEWGMDTVEFAVFPQQWASYKFMWRERTPGVFTLKKSDKGINFEHGIKLA